MILHTISRLLRDVFVTLRRKYNQEDAYREKHLHRKKRVCKCSFYSIRDRDINDTDLCIGKRYEVGFS